MFGYTGIKWRLGSAKSGQCLKVSLSQLLKRWCEVTDSVVNEALKFDLYLIEKIEICISDLQYIKYW